jgi:autotransporter-associated beta strand protein
LQGNETITLAPAAGTERISGVNADQSGSGGTSAGNLTLNGAGTLDLTAANTCTGATTIDQGVLELVTRAPPGGFGFRHENDDAWGLVVAWSGSTGHGPDS